MKSASSAFAGKIRPAHHCDHERIAELAGQLSYPSTPEEIARRLEGLQRTAETAVFVAELEAGEIAGWIAVFVYRTVEADARAEVSGLVVDERFRSQRVGEHLLARAEEWARGNGCQAIALALERNPRPGARILRTSRLRTHQDAESLPQAAVTIVLRLHTFSELSRRA